MTEAQKAIVAQRAAKLAAKRAYAARAAKTARAQMKAASEKKARAAALAEIEKSTLTRWRKGADSEPSGYAGGKPLCNYDWLLSEKRAHAAAGIAEFTGIACDRIYEVKRKLLRKGVVVRKKLGLKADLEEGRQ